MSIITNLIVQAVGGALGGNAAGGISRTSISDLSATRSAALLAGDSEARFCKSLSGKIMQDCIIFAA